MPTTPASRRPVPAAPTAELLDLARLREAAFDLATRVPWVAGPRPWRLGGSSLSRLDRLMASLARVYGEVARDVHRGDAISPAAEWLLDNYHLIVGEVGSVRHDLPAGYYRRLPRLGDAAGPPRVERLAQELIKASDGRLDAERLRVFLMGFQAATPLTIGELWAWPSVLKLTLVARVAALAARIDAARAATAEADAYLSDTDARAPTARPDIAGASNLAFIVRLLQRMREYGDEAGAVHEALASWLAGRRMTAEDAIRAEGQREATDQVSMANAVTSLRFCASLDWTRFVESVSAVEHVLQRDPAGVYQQMDFLTRDDYRRAVEDLAQPSGEDQVLVASAAIERARRAAGAPGGDRRAEHVGYHLLGHGLSSFAESLPSPWKRVRRMQRWLRRHATGLYLWSLGAVTLLFVLAGVAAAGALGAPAALWVAVALLIPASELATAVLHVLVASCLAPRRLPRLDLEREVPAAARTMVVVPTLFASVAEVHDMLAHVEVQALANLDPHVHFAILSDFTDADAAQMPGDNAIIAAARAGVEALNGRHAQGGRDRFYLFHRVRLWNASEGRWIGWERKRGKIEEFLRLLRGATDTSYDVAVGDLSVLTGVRYCITLDSDTRLPRDAAKALVGIALHPLNQPRMNPDSRLVVEGYGIIQPRVSVTMASAAGSLFARVYAGHTGVDPYTTAVSDVYQDAFGEGVFTGKGLLDVDAFRRALEGRVPENALLSHDLFEGLHARVALATDVEVVDDYPPTVLAHARRQRRWVRGDWQVLLWLFPFVPARAGLERNPLSLISRWKILDNLRRSLVAPALVVFLFLGWTLLPGRPVVWTLAAAAVLATPLLALVPRLLALVSARPMGVSARRLWDDIQAAGAQSALGAMLLAYHAWDLVHAIVLTLVRLFITQRRLLEWETAASAAARAAGLTGRPGLHSFEIEMASSSIIAVGALVVAAPQPPAVWWCAVPFAVAWAAAPAASYWLSRPVRAIPWTFDQADVGQLQTWARRTWRYFETHVSADEHDLPPDNVQDDPARQIARRTSPTNIGMALLATLAAHDLDYIDADVLLDRVGRTLDTLGRLERHEGHFLNWYDTASLAPLTPRYVSTVDSGNLAAACLVLAAGLDEIVTGAATTPVESSDGGAASRASRARILAARCRSLVDEMDFAFLYDRGRQLFVIGYRLPDAEGVGGMDAGYYDLLASEARLASFLAIATDDVPQRHWFRLGRAAVGVDGVPTLLSWSASMFEYLMPTLVMRVMPGTLLDATCRRAVRAHIQYGRQRGVPWGMSESAFNARDRHATYQYKAFGVPGLGLKRGLADELVVAPYASALALRFEPSLALANLRRLERAGAVGPFGFYDAVDYTAAPDGVEARARATVVRTTMAHHQGMFLVAVANALCDDAMVRRFHADPRVQATELLLQERVPRAAAAQPPRPVEETRLVALPQASSVRRFRTAHTHHPHTQILSNGAYVCGMTNAGGGFSRWNDLAVTRWREERTADWVGQAVYLRDVRSHDLWSATYQPTCREPDDYLVTFASDRVVFHRTDHGIESQLEVTVSPEDDAEYRRLTLRNPTDRLREIEVTSYAEVVLDRQEQDVAHPVFGGLFVETEYWPECAAIACHRRPRQPGVRAPWLVHVLSLEGRLQGFTEWETSRERFLGRNRSLASPASLDGRALSGTVGAVLDPVVSLRQRVRLPPSASAHLSFVTGVAPDRASAALLAQRCHDRDAAARAFAMARTHSQLRVRHLNVTADHVRQYDRLASRVFSLDESLRGGVAASTDDVSGIGGLWAHGISGDFPIVLVRVSDHDDLSLVQQVLRAQESWRVQGLSADVVVVNEHPASYLDETHERLATLVQRGPSAGWRDRPGGVYLLRGDQVAGRDRTAIEMAARAVLDGRHGDLAAHLDRATPRRPWRSVADDRLRAAEAGQLAPPEHKLTMDNGLGGFSRDGRTYVVRVKPGSHIPAPWSNVLANPAFGTLVTTSGTAFTWCANSRENRLTPFANDPVADVPSEAIYLRDDEDGQVWGATPGPMFEPTADWVVTHGAGWSRFERAVGLLEQTLDVYVAPSDTVKLSKLRLWNRGDAVRRISVFAYAAWQLGPPRMGQDRYVVTSFDEETGAVLAGSAFRDPAWAGRVAFLCLSERPTSYGGDRREFVGRHGTTRTPRGLSEPRLSNRVGANLDPCAVVHVEVMVPPGESRDIVTLLGEAASRDDARALMARHRHAASAARALAEVGLAWDDLLDSLRVETPDDSFDLLVNRWLQYQNVSSRLYARTGFYQPGGAFGFRDQLQDVMALLYSRPDACRAHIVLAASRQFQEGDVQHWWHMPSGDGVRSTCSDDLLWLPHVVTQYVRTTGDVGLLDEVVPFLTAPPLAAGATEWYGPAHVSREAASVFEHCVRAIGRGIDLGRHGLPRMGSGDWNDGMNRVGSGGEGESVWLGWFLYEVITGFAPLAEARGERDLAERYRGVADRLRGALEQSWDGEWYRRAYFDDGTPLGSAGSNDAQIDSIAQSWAVLSNAASRPRAERAMDAVRSRLIRRDAQLVLLLAPPFQGGDRDPGYIKAYPPGTRENGGQYTHAALWSVMALARLGYGEEAVELFHLLNPINHTRDTAGVERYVAEPYVVAADVSAHPQHVGRGGWTWYTASAGVMYRAAVEEILGLRRQGRTFVVQPCVPATWARFRFEWRHRTTTYRVEVENTPGDHAGVVLAELDGQHVDHRAIPLAEDGATHRVRILMTH